MASSAYIFLKRFYFKELLGYFLWALIWTLGHAFSALQYIFLSLFSLSLGDLLINFSCCHDSIASNGLN
jgi:hypothetical protein